MFKTYYAWRLRKAQHRLKYIKAKHDALHLAAIILPGNPQVQSRLVLDAIENYADRMDVMGKISYYESKVMS